MLISWAVLGKADIPSMLNGILALVAITGPVHSWNLGRLLLSVQ